MTDGPCARIRTVAVAMNLGAASARDLLTGVFSYARDNCHWRIRFVSLNNGLEERDVREIARMKPDGIITSEIGMGRTTAELAAIPADLVVIGLKDERFANRGFRTAFVRNDDEDLGRFAARYLLSLGRFRAFAFAAPAGRAYWSLYREKGFRAELRGHGVRVRRLPSGTRLGEGLAALEKPAAVFAASDGVAVPVLEALTVKGIRSPEEVAVLGVDNDQLFCDFTEPTLSSIAPNHVAEGSRAAETLARMFAGRKVCARPLREKRIIERQSTRPIPPAARLVQRALAFIEAHALEGTTVGDVVGHLGVSRRLADLRFREYQHQSIHEALTERRMRAVREQLARDDFSLAAIAVNCGFPNANYLGAVFKRRFGVAMGEYRRKALAEKN